MHKRFFAYAATCLFVFGLIFIEFFHPISSIDQDLGRHLLLGKIIWQTRAVPTINLLSYTTPNFPFINTHWLSEVIFFIITQRVGLYGLLIVMSVLGALSILLVIVFLFFQKENRLATTITLLLFSGVLLERIELRPEIFSFLFLSLFVVILYANRVRITRWLFILPVIEFAWVNMHIYFILGPFLIFLFLVERLIILGYKKTPLFYMISDKTSLFLLLVLFLACLATIANPNGISGALYPFMVFRNYGYTVVENQQLSFLLAYGFREIPYAYFGITVVLLLIGFLLRARHARLIDWLLAGFGVYFALSAVRNFPIFTFLAFVPFVHTFSPLGVAIEKRVTRQSAGRLLLIACVVAGIIFNLSIFTATNGFGFAVAPESEKAADFYIANRLSGPLFNNFDIGSYLLYRLYPQEKVFVDGRPEAYPASFFQNVYIPMQKDPSVFAKVDAQYHFNTIFFEHTDQTPWAKQFLASIVHNPSWTIVYLDDSIVILAKRTPTNQKLIEKFALTEGAFSLQKIPHRSDPVSLLMFAYFLDAIGWKHAEEDALKQALTKNPTFCPTLEQLMRLYGSENLDPGATLYANTYATSCR